MKTFLFLSAFFSFSAFASDAPLATFKAPPAPGTGPLSVKEQRLVLDAVKLACSDNWCEGDFGYEFEKFSCEGPNCRLTFTMVNYTKFDDEGAPVASSAIRNPATCTFSGVSSIVDLYDATEKYLTDNVIEKLNLCIEQYANSISSRNP